MATVTGTAGGDFIHQKKDGLVNDRKDFEIRRDLSGDDLIQGFGGNDTIWSGDGNDVVEGGDGYDRLHGGAGTDHLYGGDLDDFIYIDAASDVSGLAEILDGGSGTDFLVITNPGTYDLSAASILNMERLAFGNTSGVVEVLMTTQQLQQFAWITIGDQNVIQLVDDRQLKFSGAVDGGLIRGTDADSRMKVQLNGSSRGVQLDGAGGDDSLTVSLKDEKATLYGGAGDDELIVNSARARTVSITNSLFGGEGSDRLLGGRTNDLLDGGADGDTLTGGEGADRFTLAVASDSTLAALDLITDFNHAEFDRIDLRAIDGDPVTEGRQGFHLGGSAVTHSVGELIQYSDGAGKTILSGDIDGDGVSDFAMAFQGAVVLTAAEILDQLEGTEGADVLSGGQTSNFIFGFGGDDVITGGQGSDTLTGGLGADTFVFKTTAGTAVGYFNRDTITDFRHAEGDKIDLSGIDADILTAGDQAFTLVSAFTGVAAQLRYSGTYLTGDVDGNGQADFEIRILGYFDPPTFVPTDDLIL